MIIAIWDFEATDSNPLTARVTEAACALYETDSKKILMSFSSFMWDETYEPTNETAAKITGITDDLLKTHAKHDWNGPRFVLAQLLSYFSRADYICGHNIRRYDLILLKEELKRNMLDHADFPPNIDTRTDIIYPDHIDTRKLAYLATEHGIFAGNAHSALHDCHTTANLLFRYDLARTIELSHSPEIYVRADVSFHDKDKAKERKYGWDGEKKLWVKQIKEIFLNEEKEKSDFPVIVLQDYKPTEKK